MKEIKNNPQYLYATLSDVCSDPVEQFSLWLNDAELKTHDQNYNAFALSTCTANKPSARIVLLKSFSKQGFVFFTNFHSRKGQEVEDNPNVSMLFYWSALERQIRIEGLINKLSAEDSQKLFYDRPRISQIAASISKQSMPLKNRETLELEFEQACQFYQDENIPVKQPENMGGYIISPNQYEFWQGGPNRLNYRFLYSKTNDQWQIGSLYP